MESGNPINSVWLIYIQANTWSSGWLLSYQALALGKIWRTASFVGSAGIAPLSVTVIAPQAFANRRASLNFSSFCSIKRKKKPLVS